MEILQQGNAKTRKSWIAKWIAEYILIGCQNYERINGVAMNSFSAYPSEEEIILCDGCDMFALSVDSNV